MTRKMLCIVACAATCTAGFAAGPLPADLSVKLRGSLPQVLDNAAPGDLIPVTIVMRDQVPYEVVRANAVGNRDARYAAVTSLLKAKAAQTQTGVLNALDAARAEGKAEGVYGLWISNVVAARTTPDVILQIADRDDVDYINYDEPVGTEVLPYEEGEMIDTLEVECGVARMNTERVWNELNITGRGTVAAVIDTGVCITHPDVADHLWSNPGEIPGNNIDDDNNGLIDDVHGWNFWRDNNDLNDNDNPGAGHGTHCAGTVLGDGTNGTQTGVAPDSELMTLKVWNAFAGESIIWRATEYAAAQRAHVISLSYGWPLSQNPDKVTWRRTYENAIAAGTVSVIAAGNNGSCCPPTDSVTTPGNVPDAITAGAVDCNDVIAGFSSRGPVTWQNVPPFNDWPYPPGLIKPDATAGGVNTISLSNNCSGYRSLSGTSMATPHIAGLVALMYEFNPDLSPEEVKECIMATAVDLGAPGPDNTYGAGRVDAYEALLRCTGDPEPAACCFPDGGCEDLLRSDCVDDGGRWNFGEACEGFRCPQPGACCVTNDLCEITLERDCVARGGDFIGEGTECKDVCACDVIKKLKGKCKGSGTLKAIVKFKNTSWDGRTVKMGVGERLRFDVNVQGKKATLFTCCFNGTQEVSLLEPDGCLDPIRVNCP